ncbi:MAG TPA: hypothetical protein VGR26_14930 [Acidimicrobiales bacterium]|nr:hypothetical protein [Acidimicrobiales bacterium]
MSGTKATHKRARRRLRRQLEEQGVPAAEIDRIIARKRAEQRAGRARDGQAQQEHQQSAEAAAVREQWERETYARLSPDDRGYRPSRSDSVTTGQGRATGLAAKAAKRGKTLTRWEYDEATGRAKA